MAELDIREKKLRYINAGHFPPYLLSGGKFIRLESGCTIIGAFEVLPEIHMGEISLTQPGLIFACTDGLTDIINETGEYFDESRIEAILQQADKYPNPAALNDVLMRDVDKFRGKKPYPDDIAILTCKYKI